jgi:hypothetical protein
VKSSKTEEKKKEQKNKRKKKLFFVLQRMGSCKERLQRRARDPLMHCKIESSKPEILFTTVSYDSIS